MLLCIWNLALQPFTRTRTFDQPFPFTLSLDSTVAASTSTMPCTPAQTTCAQQAFAPLILWAHFQPESVVQMASSKLPWHQTYPLHMDGIPAGGVVLPPAPTSLPDTQVAAPVDPRMKRPKPQKCRERVRLSIKESFGTSRWTLRSNACKRFQVMTSFSYSVTPSYQEFVRVYANQHLNMKVTYTRQIKGTFVEACEAVRMFPCTTEIFLTSDYFLRWENDSPFSRKSSLMVGPPRTWSKTI